MSAERKAAGQAHARVLARHRALAVGHAFVQNLRRGHCDIATEIHDRHRLRIPFDDLALTI